MKAEKATEFERIISKSRKIFCQKTHDYGTAWRILRLPSITDQIFIKAKRIRTIQEKKTQKIDDDTNTEFLAIINYCLMALIQSALPPEKPLELPADEVFSLYDRAANQTLALLHNKNHDYNEAWREMRISSITDIILMKILRIKQIENLKGETLASEGVEANYQDILNYAIFALILSEKTNSRKISGES